jgi:hypothetical protein
MRNRDEIGRYGETIVNDSGERHINLYNPHEMKICHTFFEHKNIYEYTWKISLMNQNLLLIY